MTRCERCDMPHATANDWRSHEPGCACVRCVAICWGDATCDPVDWRERALKAEAAMAMKTDTHAAELWSAVVNHCATGRGYRIAVDGTRLTLDGGPVVYVEPSDGGWIVVRGCDVVRSVWTADHAVRYAVSLFTTSTEPNVSC